MLLFLGAAWEDLLWPFQINYLVAIAAGSARSSPSIAKTAAATSSSARCWPWRPLLQPRAPFLACFVVLILLDEDRWRRLWVIVVPAVVFAIWWLGWGHTAETAFSLGNVARSPIYVINGFASSSRRSSASPRRPRKHRRRARMGPAAARRGRRPRPRPHLQGRRLAPVPGHPCPRPHVLAARRLLRQGRPTVSSRYALSARSRHPARRRAAARAPAAPQARDLDPGPDRRRHRRLDRQQRLLPARSYDSYHETSILEKSALGAVEVARGHVAPNFLLSEEVTGPATSRSKPAPTLPPATSTARPATTRPNWRKRRNRAASTPTSCSSRGSRRRCSKPLPPNCRRAPRRPPPGPVNSWCPPRAASSPPRAKAASPSGPPSRGRLREAGPEPIANVSLSASPKDSRSSFAKGCRVQKRSPWRYLRTGPVFRGRCNLKRPDRRPSAVAVDDQRVEAMKLSVAMPAHNEEAVVGKTEKGS